MFTLMIILNSIQRLLDVIDGCLKDVLCILLQLIQDILDTD